MSKKNSTPKGFTCECGKFHEFGGYVAAHSTIELKHTCDQCGAVHSVQEYVVTLEKPGRAV